MNQVSGLYPQGEARLPKAHAMRRLPHIPIPADHVGKEVGTISSCCQQCGRWVLVGGEPPKEPKARGLNHLVTKITGTLRGMPQTTSQNPITLVLFNQSMEAWTQRRRIMDLSFEMLVEVFPGIANWDPSGSALGRYVRTLKGERRMGYLVLTTERLAFVHKPVSKTIQETREQAWFDGPNFGFKGAED